MTVQRKTPAVGLVILAFAAVYIIWGSTYFFIEHAVTYIPPMIVGSIRFLAAGIIMLAWVAVRGEKIWNRQSIIHSVISGILLLFVGNGAVIWAEQYLHSSFVAIFLASAPVWFLVIDKPGWNANFKNKFTLLGVAMGLAGVIALFYEKITGDAAGGDLWAIAAIFIGNIGWVSGSLYSKYKVKDVAPSVNAAWQMLSAGVVFTILCFADNKSQAFTFSQVPMHAWMAVLYLIVFGSIIGYSAYVFLLGARSATQVSSYAYVNPLVAVLLGVLINKDVLTPIQYMGLAVILVSVFFINLAKRHAAKKIQQAEPVAITEKVIA